MHSSLKIKMKKHVHHSTMLPSEEGKSISRKMSFLLPFTNGDLQLNFCLDCRHFLALMLWPGSNYILNIKWHLQWRYAMKTAINVTDLQETHATVVTFLQLLLCVKINNKNL